MNLWFDGLEDEILRVEVMDTSTGLGREVSSAGSRNEETYPAGENCKRISHILVLVDFNVDAVFISMNSQEAASRLDAVELVGDADLFHALVD